MNIAGANGVLGVIARAGVGWGYQDERFLEYYAQAKAGGLYRSSYHVIWTDLDVQKQADNWFSIHPEIDVIPRAIDLEVDRNDSIAQKSDAVMEMSDIVLARDGVRPIIYSRYRLIDDWLKLWSASDLNAHYYWLAQYLLSGAEHPGPPTLPDRVKVDRVLLHQTADKKPGFPGEAQSAAVDYNRYQFGDEAQMHSWIAQEWGGTPPPPTQPPADNPELKAALDDMQAVLDKHREKE